MVVGLSGREISADIIESCRRGDREAFRVLYETYKDKVYSIALYFFHGDSSAAADTEWALSEAWREPEVIWVDVAVSSAEDKERTPIPLEIS